MDDRAASLMIQQVGAAGRVVRVVTGVVDGRLLGCCACQEVAIGRHPRGVEGGSWPSQWALGAAPVGWEEPWDGRRCTMGVALVRWEGHGRRWGTAPVEKWVLDVTLVGWEGGSWPSW